MSDADICTIIDSEMAQAIGSDSASSLDRERSLDYYMGNATGQLAPPDVDGRSRVVSRDLMEVVESIMPTMMRTFCGSDQTAAFEPTIRGDEQAADDATQYCNYILHKANHGYTIIHDAIKNSLLQRLAIVKVWWDESFEETRQEIAGATEIEVQALYSDPEVTMEREPEIIQQPVIDPMTGQLVQPALYSCVVLRKKDASKVCIEGVPPDEFRISREARNADDVRFAAHVRDVTKSDLRAMGFSKSIVEGLSDGEGNSLWNEADQREEAQGYDTIDDPADASQATVQVCDAWLKIDADADGIAEWRHVMKAGKTILVNEQADGHPFVLATPILMPYQIIGISLYDTVKDITEINTSLKRQMLDNLYLLNNQRTVVVDGAVNLDDLLNPRPGGVIRAQRADAVMPLQQTPIIAPSLEAIGFFSGERRNRTGISGQGDGISPESVNRSSGVAVELVQSANRERVELIARTLAETFIVPLFKRILKLVTERQNGLREVRVNGRWMTIDPGAWRNGFGVTVSVGIGTSSKQAQVGMLDRIKADQIAMMQSGQVPPQVMYQKLWNTINRQIESMGFRDADQFYPSPDELAQFQQAQPPQQPQPDPAMVMAQAEVEKAKAQQMKAQTDMQTAEMDKAVKMAELQLDARKQSLAEAQFQHQQQMDMANLQIDTHKATEKDRETARALEVRQQVEAALSSVMQQVSSALQQMSASHAELMAQQSAPKQIIYDESGNPVGVKSGNVVQRIVRDDAGNVIGTEVQQ